MPVSRELTCQANTNIIRGKVELGLLKGQEGLTSPLLKDTLKRA